MKKQMYWGIAILIILLGIGGGLLFGTIKIIDATQTGTPTCIERTKPECIKDMPKPICPPQQERVPCPLDTAE